MMKFIFGMHIENEVFYKLVLSFSVYVARHAKRTENKKFAYLCNIFRKTWGMEVYFLPADKHKIFLKVASIFLGVLSWACPKYQK